MLHRLDLKKKNPTLERDSNLDSDSNLRSPDLYPGALSFELCSIDCIGLNLSFENNFMQDIVVVTGELTSYLFIYLFWFLNQIDK